MLLFQDHPLEKLLLRVISFNIHKGFSTAGLQFSLIKIRDAIRQIHPDLVLLQEVQGEHLHYKKTRKDWPAMPQFDYLAHEIWPHVAYGKNATYGAGHHGNAILSKYPIEKVENIDISTHSFGKRGILHAVLRIPGKHRPFHAICAHLGLFESERTSQVSQICERITLHVPLTDPLVLGGDFNDWLERTSITFEQKLQVREAFQASAGQHAKTFPSWLPSLKLDRIYFRGLDLKNAMRFNQRPWPSLSDHLPLYAELAFPTRLRTVEIE